MLILPAKTSSSQVRSQLNSGQTHVLGAGLDPETYRARFKRLCRGAGVPEIGLHRIRHTLANLLHDNAVPPKRAADLLGHSVEVHLASYITNTESGTLEAGRAVGRALWDQTG
jgi:integrase